MHIRLNNAILLPVMGCVLAAGLHAVPLGLSSHSDSRAILERSIPALLHGHYAASRSYGNPLYELMAAGLYGMGGVIAVNLYSLALALGSLFLFNRLLDDALPPRRRMAALMAFAFSPLFLVNVAAFIEWMQYVFLLLCLLSAIMRWLEKPSMLLLTALGIITVLLVLTRPDAFIACVCVFLAALWQTRLSFAPAWRLILALCIAATVALAIFGIIHGGFAFLHTEVLGGNPLARRMLIAVIGVMNVLGLAGAAVMAVLLWRLLHAQALTFWHRLFFIGLPLILLRFMMLPDKLEYIIALPVLFLLALAHSHLRTRWLWIAALSMAQPTFVTLSLFERTGTEDTLILHAHIEPGALAQEWRTTRYNRLVTEPGFLARIADRVYDGEPLPHPLLKAGLYDAGLISSMNDVIIGQSEAYRLDNPRLDERWQSRSYRRIYICDRSVYGGNIGWRLMEPPVNLPFPDPRDGHVELHCARRR